MRIIPKIPPAVARKLGHYVYLYVNPLDDSVFYVGKGKGTRALAHLDDAEKRKVAEALREIRASGAEPRIEVLAHGLSTPEVALKVEAAAIDLVGRKNLANAVRGWRGTKFGRMPLDELAAHYTRRKATIREPGILIRINKLYRYGMSDADLYDATRSAWKVARGRRERARYAFAVFEGVVREVYAITHWLPAGSTFNQRWKGRATKRAELAGRWEFVGTIANRDARDRYINRYVGHLFTQGPESHLICQHRVTAPPNKRLQLPGQRPRASLVSSGGGTRRRPAGGQRARS